MTETITIGILIAAFALPCWLLAMSIRHFIPLVRGFNAPLWAYALGPVAFATDKFFTEQARPHRKPFIGYASAFIGLSFVVVAAGSLGSSWTP